MLIKRVDGEITFSGQIIQNVFESISSKGYLVSNPSLDHREERHRIHIIRHSQREISFLPVWRIQMDAIIQSIAKVLFAFLIFYFQHAAISAVSSFPVHLFGGQTIGLAAEDSLVSKSGDIQIIIKRDPSQFFSPFNMFLIELQNLFLFFQWGTVSSRRISRAHGLS
jgi:hypothetical protein